MKKYRNAIFSVPNSYKSIIFPVHIPHIYEHLVYKYFVRRSVGHATKARNVKYETQFSQPLIETNNYFFYSAHSTHIYHLFYKYFVRRSVGQATNGRFVGKKK